MSQFIFKLKYTTSPKDNSVGAKNSDYVNYISTRLGTDVGDNLDYERELEGEEMETDTRDDLNYQKELEGEEISSNDNYLGYIKNRERSEGLFGNDPNNPPQLEEIKNELNSHNDRAWRAHRFPKRR